MRSSVLPEPAGAWTRNERVTSSARSRASASSAAMFRLEIAPWFSGVVIRGSRFVLRRRTDPAQRVEPAAFAGLGIARHHDRVSAPDLFRERAEGIVPTRLDRAPIRETCVAKLIRPRQLGPGHG